ncbi:MAG: hypothetical protein ACRDTH_11460 [Pseudonocardiaceae bacterium]
MEHKGGLAGRDTDDQRHGDVGGNGNVQWVIKYSIRPGAPCPQTVLVAAMADGSYLLMAYPLGEPVVVAKDAVPLRPELAAAFGGTDGAARCSQCCEVL